MKNIPEETKMSEDISDDVKARLEIQERKLVIQRDRAKLKARLKREKEKKIRESQIKEGDIENIENLLREDDEIEESYYIQQLLESGDERSINSISVVSEENMKLHIGKNKSTSFQEYLKYLCIDPSIKWDNLKTQTATMLLELEHPRRRDPNIRDLLSTVLREKQEDGQEFNIGQWVEILGKTRLILRITGIFIIGCFWLQLSNIISVLAPNMSWTLEIITKINKEKDKKGVRFESYSLVSCTNNLKIFICYA